MFDEEPYKIINCNTWSYDDTKDRVEIKYDVDDKDSSRNVHQIILFHTMVILTRKGDLVDIIHDSRYVVMYKNDLNKKD